MSVFRTIIELIDGLFASDRIKGWGVDMMIELIQKQDVINNLDNII